MGVAYDPGRCKAASEAYRNGSSHARAVLAGGAVSDACYAKLRTGQVPQTCEWCRQAVPPAWYHQCWECPGLAQGRPQVPREAMQARLGWPEAVRGSKDRDQQVICHMAAVRKRLLDRRYGEAVT